MKTADLIPFILLELNEQDKYGFELTRSIETKSSGRIVIKQPTLYTLLKKLEKSKFISSYWLDSEIGGKRHYYKLTENGRLQVSTLPNYEVLMKNAIEDGVENIESDEPKTSQNVQSEKRFSIMDELLTPQPTPVETVLPTAEVFAETSLDNSTETEINISNTEILKEEKVSNNEEFASNENVVKFTEKISSEPPINNIETLEKTKTILDINFTVPKNEFEINFVDYYDIKNNEQYKKSKNIAKKLALQSLATTASLVLMIILCSIITSFTGRSSLYYVFFIGAILVSIFYPLILLTNADKIRLKYQNKQYLPKIKLKLAICASVLLSILVTCIVLNISVGNNTFALMLGVKNFENIYSPMLISSVCFLDVLYNHLFLKNIK